MGGVGDSSGRVGRDERVEAMLGSCVSAEGENGWDRGKAAELGLACRDW